MKETQTEIKAIQAKLQAIRAAHPSIRPSATPSSHAPMVEMFPSSAAATYGAAANPSGGPQRSVPAGIKASPSLEPEYAQETLQDFPDLQDYPDPLVAAVVALQQSASSLRSPARPSCEPAPQPHPVEQQVSEAMKQMEAKAQQINQLSVAQENAMRELKAIAERLERDWKAMSWEKEPLADEPSDLPFSCEYLNTAVPYIERDNDGAFVVTSRAVDLFQAEREAAIMAQNLRYQRSRTSPQRRRRSSEVNELQTLWKRVVALFQQLTTARRSDRATLRSRSRSVQQETPPLSLKNVAAWLVTAAVLRIAVDVILASFPGMWIPMVGVIVAPAAIAAYRTTVAPETSVVWGYRLFLIMVGLLLGGRIL